VRVLERLKEQRGLFERIVIDNGPEFTGNALDAWRTRTRSSCPSCGPPCQRRPPMSKLL